MPLNRSVLFVCLGLSLSGCAAAAVTGAVVGTATTATKYAVKGTVGAGKLAYKGTKAAVNGTRRLMQDEPADPTIADDYDALPDPE